VLAPPAAGHSQNSDWLAPMNQRTPTTRLHSKLCEMAHGRFGKGRISYLFLQNWLSGAKCLAGWRAFNRKAYVVAAMLASLRSQELHKHQISICVI
jgi:hypothetical protein